MVTKNKKPKSYEYGKEASGAMEEGKKYEMKIKRNKGENYQNILCSRMKLSKTSLIYLNWI